MHAPSPNLLRITSCAGILALATLSGCSQERSGSGSSPLAPTVGSLPAGAEPALARISLPFDSDNFATVVNNP